MANKYQSVERRMWARNVASVALNPPADLVFPAIANITDSINVFSFPQEWVNKASKVRIISAGVFCNFADGLVPKLPGDTLELVISATGFNVSEELTGGAGAFATGGTRIIENLAGSFDTEISVGNWILVPKLSSGATTASYLFRVTAAPVTATSVSVNNYVPTTFSGKTIWKMKSAAGSTGSSKILDIKNLNMMHPAEHTLDPQEFIAESSDGVQFGYLALFANIRTTMGLTFLTKSISTGFAGDNAIFDVAMDVEVTP